MKNLIFLIIPLFCLSSCIVQNETKENLNNTFVSQGISQNFKIFTGSVYSFIYPSSAIINTGGLMGTDFLIYLVNKSGNSTFNNNLNLIVQKGTPNVTNLEVFKKMSEEQVNNLIMDANIIESTIKKDTRGESYFYIHYTGKLGKYSLNWNQRAYYKNNNFYLVTLTESASTDSMEQNISLLDGLKFIP